ncbi:hypothetical protein BDN71DRAFT_1448773, partial [Pleurotus eryngii]
MVGCRTRVAKHATLQPYTEVMGPKQVLGNFQQMSQVKLATGRRSFDHGNKATHLGSQSEATSDAYIKVMYGQLLDESRITWFHDADDEAPVRTGSAAATTQLKITEGSGRGSCKCSNQKM